MSKLLRLKLFLFIILILGGFSLAGQSIDSTQNEFLIKIKRAEQEELQKSLDDLAQHRAEIRRTRVMDELLKVSQRAKNFLKNGIDSVGIKNQLAQIVEWNIILRDGIDKNMGFIPTQRNLTISSKLNKELRFKVERLNLTLDNYLDQLVNYRNQLDSLKSDSSLYNFPKDTVGLIQYTNRLKTVVEVSDPIDLSLKKAIFSLETLENKLFFQKNTFII